jgi:hypothetical protein
MVRPGPYILYCRVRRNGLCEQNTGRAGFYNRVLSNEDKMNRATPIGVLLGHADLACVFFVHSQLGLSSGLNIMLYTRSNT